MRKKVFGIIITLIVTSMYYFSFEFYALPGYNTKKIMAAVGIVVAIFRLVRKGNTNIPKNLIGIFLLAGLISAISLFSMTYNGTMDDAYSGYISSMAVWLSASFVVCSLIEAVHSKVTIELLCKYIIAVSVIQCATVIMIDQIPAFQSFVDRYINMGQPLMKELNRLYGIGAGLDVGGIRFSLALILIAYMLKMERGDMSNLKLCAYFLAFCIITVVGSMVARTTYVGAGLGLIYLAATLNIRRATIEKDLIRAIGVVSCIVAATAVICVYAYNHNASIHYWIRFAFEGFFNLFEQGEWSIASNDTLKQMIVWPESFKTWVIGDGYFTNPYYYDPNFIWQGQNTQGFYMDTDIGYLRFIFYFGVIGLVTFIVFFLNCYSTVKGLLPKHTALFFFCLICGFVVWLKVATDVFFIFALFICVGNMQDAPPELEAEADDGDDPAMGEIKKQ